MTRFQSVAMTVIGFSAAAIFFGQSDSNQGTLTIDLSSSRGLKLPRGRVSIRSSQGSSVFTAAAEGQVVVHLPYGRYTVEFDTNWFEPARRDVVIDKPDSFMELAARFVPEGGRAPGSISVRIEPATSCSAEGFLWAKLVGVHTQDAMERRITLGGSAGYALFEPVDDGTYILMVVDGARVRAMSSIITDHQLTTATLSLSPCESR